MVDKLMGVETEVIISQKKICTKYGCDFSPSPFHAFIGFALETFSNLEMPINGLRHPIENEAVTNWYIWAGDYSLATDFFKPIHVHHLLDICPKVINYLGLPPGWRFLLDNNNYEDVWYDEALLIL